MDIGALDEGQRHPLFNHPIPVESERWQRPFRKLFHAQITTLTTILTIFPVSFRSGKVKMEKGNDRRFPLVYLWYEMIAKLWFCSHYHLSVVRLVVCARVSHFVRLSVYECCFRCDGMESRDTCARSALWSQVNQPKSITCSRRSRVAYEVIRKV